MVFQRRTSTTTVTPGQEIEYSIKILNEGTENINNAQIKIQLPYTATFVNGSQNGVINFSPIPTQIIFILIQTIIHQVLLFGTLEHYLFSNSYNSLRRIKNIK